MGVCPTSPHVFCGLGKGIQLCPSWHSVGGASSYGVGGPLLRAVWSLYDQSRSLACLPAVSQTCSRCMVDSGRAALCPWFCSLFLWTEFLGVVTGRRGSGSGVTGFHLCFSWTMFSCWPPQARTSSMSWGSLQASVKQLLPPCRVPASSGGVQVTTGLVHE